MPYVDIYNLNDDGTQSVFASCRLVNNEIVCEGDETLVRNLKQEGIFDYSSEERKKLYPKDGLKFLEQLKFNLKSGYLNASEFKDDQSILGEA